MVEHEPLFSRRNVSTYAKEYGSAYDLCEDDVMYIKIDDDIVSDDRHEPHASLEDDTANASAKVFFEDTTIPTLVHTRWTHPEYYMVSANIMNQPSLSWVHHRLGVVKPYFPELLPSVTSDENESFTKTGKREEDEESEEEYHPPSEVHFDRVNWRASRLPSWSGPEGFSATEWDPDHAPHRWLPMRTNARDDPSSYYMSLERTPIVETSYNPWGAGLSHWQLAAQEHYSFFEHLENNELWRYKFHSWDYNYERMGIQFIAMMGRDINIAKPMEKDDEHYLSEVMTSRLRRHAVVEGRGLAAHYSFGPQKEGMAKTDVLSRYRDFAMENIC
jgi:hypothetical protein